MGGSEDAIEFVQILASQSAAPPCCDNGDALAHGGERA